MKLIIYMPALNEEDSIETVLHGLPVRLQGIDLIEYRVIDDGSTDRTAGRPEYMPPIKYWGNRQVAALVSTVTGEKFDDVSCGFRAFSRESLLRLNVFGEFTYTHETILSLAYQGLRVQELPMPESLLDQAYGTQCARHFYSSAELLQFRAKWIAGS